LLTLKETLALSGKKTTSNSLEVLLQFSSKQ